MKKDQDTFRTISLCLDLTKCCITNQRWKHNRESTFLRSWQQKRDDLCVIWHCTTVLRHLSRCPTESTHNPKNFEATSWSSFSWNNIIIMFTCYCLWWGQISRCWSCIVHEVVIVLCITAIIWRRPVVKRWMNVIVSDHDFISDGYIAYDDDDIIVWQHQCFMHDDVIV